MVEDGLRNDHGKSRNMQLYLRKMVKSFKLIRNLHHVNFRSMKINIAIKVLVAHTIEQTADSRQQTADSRQQTADSRQQTADSRQQTADSRQQTADSRQQTADSS